VLVGHTDAASINGMTVAIDHSEFNSNGLSPSNPFYGFVHNLYVNGVDSLTVTDSYFHDALGGHEIKSRAQSTTIQNNRIADGPTAETSYSIDVADGGPAVISNNLIEKGPQAQNKNIIHYGTAANYPNSSLQVSDNTIVNDRASTVTGVLNQSQDGSGKNIPALIKQNMFYGLAAPDLFNDQFGPPFDQSLNNAFASGPGPEFDTSHPFSVPPLSAPEPSGATLLPLALLATVVLRRRNGRRRSARLLDR